MAEHLLVYDFGKQLLAANDLDPVYRMLWNADVDLPAPLLRKWLLAYWCFYHVGTATWIASQPGDLYWERMFKAAGSKQYPRSPERRHFRGENAVKSVQFLYDTGMDDLWGEFNQASYERKAVDAADVMEIVQSWVGFGPWIAFKVADMLERVGILNVLFSVDDVMLFDSPQEGAERLWQDEGEPTLKVGQSKGAWAVSRILDEVLGDAPPSYDRPLGVQEAETCLCKWKSYLGGHYHVGEDVKHTKDGLLAFARCPLAQVLLKRSRGDLW